MPRPSTNYKNLRARLITPVPQPVEPPQSHQEPLPFPAHWTKGELLNVRHNGSAYIVTLLAEEFDPHYPERAKFFDNSFDCQTFVSNWYSRESHDPRA